MRRQKLVALVVSVALTSSLGLYIAYDLGQNSSSHKENLQAIFYEQGLPKGDYWSVTIHPYDSPSNITTLSTNSTKIVFDNLRASTYNYSFSQINGDLILSYGGINTSFGVVGTQSGSIWVGTKLIPAFPDGKITAVNTVYTLGVYYPKVIANDVGVYLNDNGTLYNLTRSENSIVYLINSSFTYIVDSNFNGILFGNEYRINSIGTNNSEYGNIFKTNPGTPIVNSMSNNLTFTVNLTSLPHVGYYSVVMYGY
ncbi:hypothetical protein IX51_06290 [uncultured archaeon]|nr:hypothetical protein IX51_06290 [uncultured archaeon]